MKRKDVDEISIVKKVINIGGIHLRDHSLQLYNIVKSLQDGSTVLEIGMGAGKSTKIILMALNGHLFSIDKNTNLEFNNATNLTLLNGYDLEILDNWNEKLDLVFIDLDKDSNEEHYFKLFTILNKFLKTNGIIMIYNTVIFGNKIIPSINRFLIINKEYEFINLNSRHGLGIISRNIYRIEEILNNK